MLLYVIDELLQPLGVFLNANLFVGSPLWLELHHQPTAYGMGSIKLCYDAAFERVLKEAKARMPMRLLASCRLPNHWHLVVWPFHDGGLLEWLPWLTVAHTQRWHAHHHTAGTEPVGQGRFKSCVIQHDEHLLGVCRYVERSPLRANLATQPETWRWGSLWHRVHGTRQLLFDNGPSSLPDDWPRYVARARTETELAALRNCVIRGSPHSGDAWRQRTAQIPGRDAALRPRGPD